MDFKCRAPWEGLFVNPDGDFRVCCAGGSLGNLNNNTIEELLEDGPLATLRNDMLTKGSSDYCTGCHEQHKRTGKSLRDLYDCNTDPLQEDTFIPKSLDVRWHNTCQLRCNYCNPEWSSAYASWVGKHIKVSATDWQTGLLNYLKNTCDKQITDLQLLGGEPLLMRENLDLLDLTTEKTRLGVVTNLSVKNLDDFPVYKKLTDMAASWLVSFECIGDKFNYVRRNADWKITEYNYKRLKQEAHKDSNVGIHYTYTLMSAFTLVETFDWLYSIEPDPKKNSSFISTLEFPHWLDVMNYPKEIKDLAIQEIEALQDKHGGYLNEKTNTSLTILKKELTDRKGICKYDALYQFKDEIKKWDQDHTHTFEQLWPQVYDIIQSYVSY